MKLLKYLQIILLSLAVERCMAQTNLPDSSAKLPAHPRILFFKDQEKQVIAGIQNDEAIKKINQFIIGDCETLMNKPPVEDIKIGRRLLDKSRECLHRVFYLAYAYRVTRQEKYLKRAEQEMLAVSAFADWNPTHFLDVAEMTTALAIGYDWLYNDLPTSSRTAIKNAILTKGLQPSLDAKYNSWTTFNHNWNQVCNTGMAFGALATFEDHPGVSAKIIDRAIETIKLPIQRYAPDGAYAEGYSYWEYGTTYNVLFISALESAFKQDFGLSQIPGFLKTATFLENMTGATGNPFNFSDSGTGPEFNPAVFWFAKRLNDPSLLWVTRQQMATKISLKSRFLPAVLVWGNGLSVNNAQAPNANTYVGNGPNSVALMRTSWTNTNAIFVGFKAGSPSENHAHMDVGSFVMEADGVRWGIDLGMQEYETLESKGVDLWNMGQNSQRWKVFRYNNFAHNTLTLNGQLQNVKGAAAIISNSNTPMFMNAEADLTTLYTGKAEKVVRGVAIADQKYVVIRDEIQTGTDTATVRWSMVTPAEVKILNTNTVELTKNGKTLLLKIEAPNATIKTWSTKSANDFDALNPGTQIVGFEARLPANSKNALTVFLIPASAGNVVLKQVLPLAQWPH